MNSTQKSIVDRLQPYTTCDVSDALCKLKVTNGGFLSGLTMWSPARQEGQTKIIGPAYTVKYVSVASPEPKLTSHYIDSVPDGSVVFVSSPKTPNAVYGGLMTHRARARGAVGAVIDGRFRDLQEHRDVQFPIFARDVGTSPPYETVKVAAVNVAVGLQTPDQDITIHPGDYIIADLNGVVVLPSDLADKAIPLMARQVEADAKVMEALDNGMGFTEAVKKFR